MKWLLIVVAILFVSACAHRETIALLPNEDGKAGTLSVQTKDGSVKLNEAYGAAEVSDESVKSAKMTQSEVAEKFSAVLNARPLAPIRFTLYFIEGGDRLTPDSVLQIPKAFSEIRNRPAPDVQVIGHTDRVGAISDNDALALKRAEKIRSDLIQQGLDGDTVVASGRGEREPLVPTEDEVPEPRNRRVELYVR